MPTKVLIAIVSDVDFFAVYRSEDISFHPTLMNHYLFYLLKFNFVIHAHIF